MKKIVLILGVFLTIFIFSPADSFAQLSCGTETSVATADCACASGLNPFENEAGTTIYCCGAVIDGQCTSQATSDDESFHGPTSEFFNNLNPLTNEEIASGDATLGEQLSTPGGIISRVLRYALPLAGMLLFIMLLWGGFEILVGAAGKKSMDAGKQRITAAVVGFILLFASYWIMQVIEIVFGVSII